MTFHLLSFKFAYILEQQYARRASKWNKINKLDLCRDTVSHQTSAREVGRYHESRDRMQIFSQFVMARYSTIWFVLVEGDILSSAPRKRAVSIVDQQSQLNQITV